MVYEPPVPTGEVDVGSSYQDIMFLGSPATEANVMDFPTHVRFSSMVVIVGIGLTVILYLAYLGRLLSSLTDKNMVVDTVGVNVISARHFSKGH